MSDPISAPPVPMQPPGVLRRLHGALMPDYNAKATAYWWSMVVLGLVAAGVSLVQIASLPWPALLQVAGGVALAMLMALFPLKIPRTNQVFSIGDVFIFLLLLAHGAAAGCLAAGLEGLVSSWRSSRRWTTRLGSATIATCTMFLCGHLLEAMVARLAVNLADHAAALVLASMVFGVFSSGCNALLMSTVARLKRSEPLHLSHFIDVFGWVGGATAGAAAIAALLFITQRLAGLAVMLTILPIIGLLLTTLHFLSRQQIADEAVRRATALALEHEAILASSLAAQREAEQAAQHMRELQALEQRFHSAFTHASIGMALVSSDGRVHQANPALHALLGCEDGALLGLTFGAFVTPSDRPRLDSMLTRVSGGANDTGAIELPCRRHDEGEAWASISCSLFSEPDADGPNLLLQVQDVSARHLAEVELQHRAFHDKLTGLPNRERFYESLAQAILRSAHDSPVGDSDTLPGQGYAVLFLDFDRFKLINDSKGHGVGDEFLVQASRRLASCLRQDDMLARLGGDEFAVLATGLHSDRDAVDMAERLLMALRAPLRLSAMEIAATASIGITFSSMGYQRPEDMLRDADIAMYRAKVDGKNRYALFDARLHTEVANRVRLEADLRHALREQRLELAYQPLYELGTRRLTGFEALARWTHPELGAISPGIFIPIAEESGLILALTEFAVREACRQLREWQAASPALQDLHVHVNVSARDVADPHFVPRVNQALRSTGLAARHLVIELTENILMAQLSAAMGTLTALRDLGVGLSVDDFGTGYSSLSHLAVLPIDSLKIDMSFVRHLRPGSKEAAVIRAIVLLGTSLDKEVIVEGVETAEQMALLCELGCTVGQGYYLSRPLPPAGITRLLESDRPPAAAAARDTVAAPAEAAALH